MGNTSSTWWLVAHCLPLVKTRMYHFRFLSQWLTFKPFGDSLFSRKNEVYPPGNWRIPKKLHLKMIFLFPRWDMLIPWRVNFYFMAPKGWGQGISDGRRVSHICHILLGHLSAFHPRGKLGRFVAEGETFLRMRPRSIFVRQSRFDEAGISAIFTWGERWLSIAGYSCWWRTKDFVGIF